MKMVGKLGVVVAIGVAGFLGVTPTVSAAPCPVTHGQSTGSGGLAPNVSAAPAPVHQGEKTDPDGVTAGHPWHG